MKEEVRKAYGEIASGEACCLPEESCCTANLDVYGEYLRKLPPNLNFRSLGCGTPLAFELLGKGEKVLDIGSGEGIEAIIAAMMVGGEGLVIGLDFTEEMLEKARENRERCGLKNLKFVKGEAEEIPFPEGYFDTVISNCVINLVENKPRAIGEIFRVLKEGGKVLISDIVSEKSLPQEIREDSKLWSSCIGGALPYEEYINIFRETGFSTPYIFEQKEIRFKGIKLWSITFKALKLPSHIKIEAREVEKGIFLFPSQPAWVVGDGKSSVYFKELARGVKKENLIQEGEVKRELVDVLALRGFLSSNFKKSDYEGRKRIKPNLKEVWLHLTQKCNLRCRYCLVKAGKEVSNPLTIEEIRSILEEASSLGAKRFYVTGGEPYLRENYKEIFKLIMNFGELVVLTNATLIREDSYIPPPERALFQVSLDGTERSNELLRGKGSFKKALRGIKALQNKGHFPVVASVVTKENLFDLPNLTLLLGELGLLHHHLLFLHQRGRACKKDLTPLGEELVACVERIIEAGKKVGVSLVNYQALTTRLYSPQGEKRDLCHAGVEMLTIGPQGEVYPCPSAVGEEEFILGNIREESLAQIWNGSPTLKKIREVTLMDCKECRVCAFRFYCGGGCLLFKLYYGSSFKSKDPYCSLYKYFLLKKFKEMKKEKSLLFSPFNFPLGKGKVTVFNCA